MLSIKRLIGDIKGGEKPPVLGMACSYSPELNGASKGLEDVKFIKLPCDGMIHPSWVEYGLNLGVESVFIYGCQTGNCHYRFGNKWIEERILSRRAPLLKKGVDRERIRFSWAPPLHSGRLLKGIKRFAFASIVLLIPALLISYITDTSYTFSNMNESQLLLSVRHAAQRIEECDDLTMINREAERYRELLKETDRVMMDLEKLGECKRERYPIYVELYIDNEKVLGKEYTPGGVKRDGPSFAFEKFSVKPGVHKILARMRDSRDGDRFDYSLEDAIEFKAGNILVIDFDESKKGLRVS